MKRKTKTISWTVSRHGIELGTVRTIGRMRHIATARDGKRIGTFDTYTEAEKALVERGDHDGP